MASTPAMKELQAILGRLRAGPPGGVLATLVAVEGSSYRRPGARMWIEPERRIGSLSGGCLEEDLSPDCGLVVPVSADFVTAARAQIAAWHQDRLRLATAKAAARRRFSELRSRAEEDYRSLLECLAGRAASGQSAA